MGWGGGGVVAHKILVSAPVPWIGDLGLGDWGLGLDNFDNLFLKINFACECVCFEVSKFLFCMNEKDLVKVLSIKSREV